MKPVVTGADMHGIHEFEKGSIDDAGYGNPMFLAINIPVFTNDELVNFARVYTKENGYKIDQMGMLALYNLIGVNQKEDQPMNIGAVKEMLDAAMAKSQGGLLKFNKKKRVDRDGFTVLYEKDFAK